MRFVDILFYVAYLFIIIVGVSAVFFIAVMMMVLLGIGGVNLNFGDLLSYAVSMAVVLFGLLIVGLAVLILLGYIPRVLREAEGEEE